VDRTFILAIALVFILFSLIYFAIKLIVHLRKKKTNTELWATVFEGLTHKTMDIEPLKVPQVYIEKKIKRSGQEKDATCNRDAAP